MSAALGLKGKNVVVLGLNESGVELSKYLIQKGATVVLADSRNSEEVKEYAAAKLDLSKLSLELGEVAEKVFTSAQLIVVSAGNSLDLPVLEAARAAGVSVVSELEFVSLYSEAQWVSVAGTSGKSTIAYLLENILAIEGKKVFSNAFAPLSKALNAPALDYVVAALTPMQVERAPSLKSKLVVFSNATEDFLDRYLTLDAYQAALKEIFKGNNEESINILNASSAAVNNLSQSALGKKVFFGSQPVAEGSEGAWASKYEFYVRYMGGVLTYDLRNFRLRGAHNRENLMAASLAALQLGAKPESIAKLIETVRAPAHRVEFIKRLNNVAFYDDSASANPDATLRTLQAFNEPVILISGGRDKNADYTPLIPHIRQRVKNLILVGEAKEKINRAIGDFTETFLVGTVEEAVLLAYQKSRGGDVILLSPACSASDMFTHFSEKGEFFQRLIAQIAQPRRPNVL